MKRIVLDQTTFPVMLFTGVPGIGKSLFSIFCMMKILLDDEFPLKEFLVEYERGVYLKFAMVTKQVNNIEDATSPVKWSAECTVHIERHLRPTPNDLILSDIKGVVEPEQLGRWTCIFASPNPNRYKETIKVAHRYTFIGLNRSLRSSMATRTIGMIDLCTSVVCHVTFYGMEKETIQ